MAVNPNEERENHHTLAIGMSGSGKTFWLKKHPKVKKHKGNRVLVWDPYESHDCHYIKSKAGFARAVAGAIKSKKGFRIGLSIQATAENFEFFCAVVWAALDGDYETVAVIEEMADVTGAGKAGEAFGQLIRVGRKFGAALMGATQRPQEIPKTLFTQTAHQWYGLVNPYDRTYCEKYAGVSRGAFSDIKPKSYEFAYVTGPDVQWGGPKKKVDLHI